MSVLLDVGYPVTAGDMRASLVALARRELEARSRAEVLADLEQLRTRARLSRRPDIEDVVLDVMDLVSGWTGPDARV